MHWPWPWTAAMPWTWSSSTMWCWTVRTMSLQGEFNKSKQGTQTSFGMPVRCGARLFGQCCYKVNLIVLPRSLINDIWYYWTIVLPRVCLILERLCCPGSLLNDAWYYWTIVLPRSPLNDAWYYWTIVLPRSHECAAKITDSDKWCLILLNDWCSKGHCWMMPYIIERLCCEGHLNDAWYCYWMIVLPRSLLNDA